MSNNSHQLDANRHKIFSIKSTIFPVSLYTSIVIGLSATAAYLLGYNRTSITLIAIYPLGIAAILIHISDLLRFVSGRIGVAFVIKFIFRLACFGVLIYVAIDKLKGSPFGCAMGLTIPIFCTVGVITYKEQKSIEE